MHGNVHGTATHALHTHSRSLVAALSLFAEPAIHPMLPPRLDFGSTTYLVRV